MSDNLIRLSTISDFMVSISCILDITPEAGDIVFIASGPDNRVINADFLPVGHDRGLPISTSITTLARTPTTSVVLIGYGSTSHPTESVLDIFSRVARLTPPSIQTTRLWVCDDPCWNLDCADPDCCPPDGIVINANASTVPASFALQGRAPATRTRSQIRADLAPIDTHESDAVAEAIAALPKSPSIDTTLSRLPHDTANLTASDMAAMLHCLADRHQVADAMVSTQHRPDALWSLWLRLLRSCPPSHRTPSAVLTSWNALLGHDRATATAALQIASPSNTLAALTRDILTHNIPPDRFAFLTVSALVKDPS